MFFVPQLGSMIYTMNGMVTQLHLQADQPGDYYGQSAQFSGDGFSDMNFTVRAVPADAFDGWVATRAATGPALERAATRRCPSRARTSRPSPIGRSSRACSTPSPPRRSRRARAAGRAGPARTVRRARSAKDVRQADLDARSPGPADPADRRLGGRHRWSSSACSPGSSSKGILPYLWREWITSVDHKRIGVMYCTARPGDAAARLHRRDHDAHRSRRSRSTPPAICRPSITTRSSRRMARS